MYGHDFPNDLDKAWAWQKVRPDLETKFRGKPWKGLEFRGSDIHDNVSEIRKDCSRESSPSREMPT